MYCCAFVPATSILLSALYPLFTAQMIDCLRSVKQRASIQVKYESAPELIQSDDTSHVLRPNKRVVDRPVKQSMMSVPGYCYVVPPHVFIQAAQK